MEMDNQVLQQMMNTQTLMMQQLTTMQQENGRDKLLQEASKLQTNSPSMGTNNQSITNPIASPITPPLISGIAPPGALAVSDPTKYGTYAAPDFSGGRQPNAAANFTAKGFVAGTLTEMRSFDATQHSKESTAQFISDQTRGIQEQAVSVMGGVVGGATSAGSLFLPGIIPALAIGGAAAVGVGGATSALVNETKEALNYQDILQKDSYKFLNAFESSNEMGGIGMGLEERQDISKFMRDLAPEKFLDSQEMSQILSGASNNNLLKSVSDVKDFKKKFSEVVDAVKEITVTMNQTIEEATKFMGEMESRGISTKDMPMISAQSKVMASMLGVSATEGAQMLLQTSDAVTAGTTLDPTKVIQSSSQNMFFAQELYDSATESNPELAHYIKNNGGAGQAGAQFEQASRGFIQSDRGKELLMGMYSSGFTRNENGGFDVNQEAMNDLLNGSMSTQQMQSQSQTFLSTLSNAEKAKLQGTISDSFSGYASSEEQADFLRRNAELIIEQSGGTIDMQGALIASGAAADYQQAQLVEGMIDMSSDPNLRKMFNSRALKEEMDSSAISNSPGLFKQIGFAWERNVTNRIGDVGQDFSDSIGTAMTDYQKFITGVDDRSMVGGELLPSFSNEGLREAVDNVDAINESSKNIGKYLVDNGRVMQGLELSGEQINKEHIQDQLGINKTDSLSSGMMNFNISQSQKGNLSAVELAKLTQLQQSDSVDAVSGMRAEMVKKEATGQYDGLLGNASYVTDRASVAVTGTVMDGWGKVEKLWNGDTSDIDKAGSAKSSLDNLDKQQEELKREKKALGQDVMSLYGSGKLDLNEADLQELEGLIQAGDVEGVKSITDNKEAIGLADRYDTLSGLESDYSKGMGTFTEMSRYTKGLATSGTQLGDLFNATGAYSESEIDDMVGDLRKKGKKVNKDMKKGKLSYTEMVEADRDMINDVDALFEQMPQYDMNQLAEYLVSKDQSIKIDEFYQKGKNGVIDSDKLREYVMDDVIRNQHASSTNKEGKKGDSGDASKAAKEHEEAMGAFVSTFQNETQMLREAVAGNSIGSTNSNQTSLGGR